MISPASGPTTSRRCWIFFLSSNSLHSSTYKCVHVNITHRKVTSSTAHAPDLQPVVFCIKPESLFSFLEKEDLHVTQSVLQLHNLPLTLPYVPLQLMLKGDGVRRGRASRGDLRRSSCFYRASPAPLCSSCSAPASAAAPPAPRQTGRSFVGRNPAARGTGASEPAARGWREAGSPSLWQESGRWI